MLKVNGRHDYSLMQISETSKTENILLHCHGCIRLQEVNNCPNIPFNISTIIKFPISKNVYVLLFKPETILVHIELLIKFLRFFYLQ
jgi:hypothetical protein